MAHSEFPIINFAARSQDNGKTPGGGDDKKKVKWLLEKPALQERSEHLVSELKKLEAKWDNTKIDGLPHVLKVDFIENALANTHQRGIAPMFIVGDNTGQIGFIGQTSLIIKIDSQEKLKTIQENLADTKKNAKQISALTAINFFDPDVKPANEELSYKLRPLNFGDKTLNERAVQVIKDALTSKNIEHELVYYSKELPAFKLNMVTTDSLKFVRTLPIRSAEPMEEVSDPFRLLNDLNINYDEKLVHYDVSANYPVVGLLDTGVNINSLTQQWVTRGKGCQYSNNQLNTAHGTYIATLLIHGDSLSDTNDSSVKGCKIVDVPVIPESSIDGAVLANNIRIAVESNPKVRVWNLSVSLKGEVNPDEFSDFAIALDDIQEKNNIIICKSAGNDQKFYQKSEAGSLSIGAESIRSITVGSLNRNSDPFNYSKANFPAPYSRKGPAPATLVKPDLTHFGGDLFALNSAPSSKNDFQEVSDTATPDGFEYIHKVGTSFSTPKVAKNLAELDLLTKHKYLPRTIKALAVHSGKYYETPALSAKQRLDTMGYGKPDNAAETIFGSLYSSTMVLEGAIKKGTRLDIMEFPYPDVLIRDGHFTGKVKVTLLYDPVLMANQGTEYCQSNLDIKFGTYDKKLNATDYMRQFNPIKRDGSFNTLLQSHFGKNKIKKNPDYATERTLINYGQKYHPVKKYVFDLSELRDSYLDSLKADHHWFLFLEGHYRLFAEKDALQKQENLNTPFTLIVTIDDPEQQAHVYTSTIQALDANNFSHNSIKIDNSIHLSNQG